MTYKLAQCDLWGPGNNRVTTWEPGSEDLFVVTTLGGKRAFVWPVYEYERAVQVAHGFANRIGGERPVTIRVQPMTADEFLAFAGLAREQLAGGSSPEEDAADKQLAIDTCMTVLRESNEPTVRADALKLLTSMGVMP